MDKLSEHLTLTNEDERVRENICLELTKLFSPYFECELNLLMLVKRKKQNK